MGQRLLRSFGMEKKRGRGVNREKETAEKDYLRVKHKIWNERDSNKSTDPFQILYQ